MDTTVADSLIGALLDGRYRVRARVARGGMATVYTGLDERLERTVALKVIHPTQARDPGFVDRFNDEAKTIARLTHPNVVAVYDQGTHLGLPYLVMEYVRGRTLREVLADRRRLAPQEALAILEQMLAAIAAAHRSGLVHRDVKPENVLVAEAPTAGVNSLVDGVVKVADFGLARAVEASADDANGAQLLATVAYVAPELVTAGHADPRTDVYAAGVVLFEMLTGRVPYEGDRPVDVAWQHVDRDVPPPSRYVPGLPPVLDDLVARATRRDPAGRPSDAGVLLAEVQAVRDDVGLSIPARSGISTQPTMPVPQLAGDGSGAHRPSWARLPSPVRTPPRTGTRRRRSQPTALDRLLELKDRVLAHPRGRIGVAGALVVLGLLAAVGGWWFGVGRYTIAPNLVQASRVQAETLARQGGFHIRYDKGRFDEKVPKDTVLVQRPGAGQRIVSGGTIVLTLSLGPERYQVPDVIGKPYDLARQDVESLRLRVTRGEAYSDDVPAGSVAVTDPPVGTALRPGDTVVLKVSKGRAPITMPNVTGRNVNEARAQLAALGLQVAVKQQDSDKPRDQVIAQDPVDGSGLERNATVTLTVSNGPPAAEVPDVVGHNADEARQILQQAGFAVNVIGAGTVRFQNPGAHDRQPPGTTVTIWCFG